MSLLGMLALDAQASGGMRPIYLVLLIVAILLLLAGCGIALVTLRNQRKNSQLAIFTLDQMESDSI